MLSALVFGGRLQRLGEPVERAEIVEEMTAAGAAAGRQNRGSPP